jgi:hypothetical protein
MHVQLTHGVHEECSFCCRYVGSRSRLKLESFLIFKGKLEYPGLVNISDCVSLFETNKKNEQATVRTRVAMVAHAE